MGVWLEIVTLLIPGFNDSDQELQRLTEFIASVSSEIPWHVTAFHQDYKMTSPADTSARDLLNAVKIGQAAGLKYIYAGNLPGRVGNLEDTRCHHCDSTLIRRYAYLIEDYRLTSDGCCPDCGTRIPGRWLSRFAGQRTASPFLPRRVAPLVTIQNRS